MGVKFRDIKNECREMVEKYRAIRKDDRQFPEFFIHCLASDGSIGSVQLYRKARGKKPYFSKKLIHYESIAELAFILENLGNAWSSTTPNP
jgi:hypothetical protein